MRALRFDKPGSLDALKVSDIPKRVSHPNEVLVEVKAAAVNPSDTAFDTEDLICQGCAMLGELQNQFSLTRAALRHAGAQKANSYQFININFLSMTQR
jgi:hypothetical protein